MTLVLLSHSNSQKFTHLLGLHFPDEKIKVSME